MCEEGVALAFSLPKTFEHLFVTYDDYINLSVVLMRFGISYVCSKLCLL